MGLIVFVKMAGYFVCDYNILAVFAVILRMEDVE